MFDRDRWNEIWHVLKSNKLRTFLTAFGVFWGIFMLVVMIAAGRGLENSARSFLEDFATNSTIIWGEKTSLPYKGLQRGRQVVFDTNDLNAIKQNFPEIQYIAPRIDIQPWRSGANSNQVVYGTKQGAFDIFGTTPEFNSIDPRKMYGGRYLNQIDIEENRKVAAISKRAKELLFNADEDPVGKYIKINNINFQVIGVFEASRIFGGQTDKPIVLPLTTLQKAYNTGPVLDYFAVSAYENINIEELENRLLLFLKNRHKVDPEDKQAIGNLNVSKMIQEQSALFIGINILIWIVGLGTLLSGVVGVSNIMLIVVKERTREIGIQRAIGASPSRIMTQIVSESVALTALAGFTGLTFGVFITEMASKFLPPDGALLNPTINFNVSIIALIVIMLCGIIAGFMPARRAVSIKPIDALRDE